MAARDQALFLETFIGLQRALKRKPDDSDSDSDIDHSTNRGNKLKRRARLVREGQLGAADGLSVFAETIEHAGYRRNIISHNPPLVDDDGYEVDSDEDDEAAVQEAEAAAADANPYAGIRLEHILAPLTAVTDLPSHPTLSRPFTSNALAELATQGGSWMHKENAALWKVKPLLTKFCGDHIWVDCALLVTPDDADLFDDDFVARLAATRGPGRGPAGLLEGAPEPEAGSSRDGDDDDDDADMPDAEKKSGPLPTQNGERALIPASVEADEPEGDADADADADADSSAGDGLIHPLFLAPSAAHPDPNLGLPEAEAEDVRRLLQLWVQKQEEVARGTKKLHEGLLRADRLRRTVFQWAKAEAHSGANRDMSDGEDWYDMELWGLAEDLKKGHDEEEDDLQQPQKKTRNRK